MLALGSAALAGTGAAMIVIMVMMVVMMVMMLVVMIMVVVAMLMIMVVVMMVMMFVIVMVMHRKHPPFFCFVVVLYREKGVVSKYLFLLEYPPAGLAYQGETVYNRTNFAERGGRAMSDYKDHEHLQQHIQSTAHSHGHIHENQKAVVNRLARAIGHLEKVKRMVESGQDCSEVLVQLAAVRSAIDNTGKVILQDHLRHCMVDAVAAGDEDAIDDLCRAIERYMK